MVPGASYRAVRRAAWACGNITSEAPARAVLKAYPEFPFPEPRPSGGANQHEVAPHAGIQRRPQQRVPGRRERQLLQLDWNSGVRYLRLRCTGAGIRLKEVPTECKDY
jgi:hypothetical protein